MRTPLLLAPALVLGCLTPEDVSISAIPGRPDLELHVYKTRIQDGLSGEVTIELPDGLQSMLIEVRGKKGLYYLTKFGTPRGDLIEGAAYMTRFAREVPGLVDWLYPNTPTLEMEGGTYQLLLRGEARGGGRVSEDVEVRLYTKKAQDFDTCGIHLDFLVDQRAIDSADFELAVDRATEWVNNLYAPRGIRVLDYSLTQISLPNPRFDVNETETVLGQIDDVLAQARAAGTARKDSVHVVVVRTIGGSEPSGYAMGLPGPFDGDRSTAAVLVSTDAYTDGQGFLNVEGMASTIAHEIGHYMGLYHTSEASGLMHDPLPDTPQCSSKSCSPDYNRNIMTGGGGASRNILTRDQAFVVKQHPLCVPTSFAPTTCSLSCEAPQTCSVVNNLEECRARTCCSTPTTRWTGIPGARRRSSARAAEDRPISCRSATRPATGATSWSTSRSRTRRSRAS
jgi:hypothetical protein